MNKSRAHHKALTRPPVFGLMEFPLGQSLKSDTGNYYRIVQSLGEGKSASAYLTLRTSSSGAGTFSVLKIMSHPEDIVRMTRFVSERDIVAGLSHDSVMRYLDAGTFASVRAAATHPFYVCDFYSRTLTSIIHDTRITLTNKVTYAIQLCSALSYLDSKGLVHCDIKPDNIYVDGIRCVLADFGLCRNAGDGASSSELPSLHKYRTPDIVSAIQNKVPLTTKSDVFQLGLVLAELFTGENPCEGCPSGNDDVVLREVKPVYGILGNSVHTLISRMLTIDASQRPDAGALIDQWQGLLFNAYGRMLTFERNVF